MVQPTALATVGPQTELLQKTPRPNLVAVVEVDGDDQPQGHGRVGDFEVVDQFAVRIERQARQDPHILGICWRKSVQPASSIWFTSDPQAIQRS